MGQLINILQEHCFQTSFWNERVPDVLDAWSVLFARQAHLVVLTSKSSPWTSVLLITFSMVRNQHRPTCTSSSINASDQLTETDSIPFIAFKTRAIYTLALCSRFTLPTTNRADAEINTGVITWVDSWRDKIWIAVYQLEEEAVRFCRNGV